MDIKSILSNIFQFAKNNQFKVKLDDKLDLEPLVEALKERRNHEETQKMLLVTQNAMMVKDTVEETNKKVESAKKELNFTREEIEKLDAKVKELNNFKGEKGDSPSLQELREIIEPLILPPIKGDPGKDYVLTAKDKKEIAKSIKVPIVEKTVETIIEKQPIVTNEIKEVAVTESSEKIKEKLESLEGDGRLDAKAIKNLPKPSFGGGIKRIDGALDTRIISPANGQTLVWNSTRQVWENSSAGGSGTPAGSDTQVQFNDGGSFGGDAGLTYNKTTNALTVGDVLVDDEAYDATNWDGSLEVPTKNAVRDKIESLSAGSGHTIKEAGTPLTQRAGLNFGAGFDLSDDAGNDETDVALDLSEYTGADLPVAGGGTGAGTAEDARTNLGLVIGTNIQAYDSDLTTIAGLTATTNNIIQSVSSAWASRTPTQVTATLDAMVGDSGAGGTKGLVPAPATGDATKFLKGDGTWGTPSGSGDALTTDPLSQFAATTSLQLAGVISDETGSGSLVFGTSPGFTTAANPVSNDGAALGTTALGWSDLFLASGGVINFAASDTVLTHSTGVLTVSTGDLRVTTAGSNAASVVTVGGSQTITGKTFNSGTFNNLTVNDTTFNNAVIQGVNSLSIDNAVYIKWRNAADSAYVNGLRLNASDVLEMDAALTLGTTKSLTCGSIELGAASDTTLSRVSAGVVAIEGKNILTTDGGTLTGNITLGENTSIALDPAGSADGKYSGITVTGVAGYTQAFGDCVYLDPTDSRWELCDANATAGADGDSRGMIGIVVSAGTDGNACTILLHGIIRADAKFPAFTINNPIYISETAGELTQTQPTTTDAVIRICGFALTADEMYWNPDNSYITHA